MVRPPGALATAVLGGVGGDHLPDVAEQTVPTAQTRIHANPPVEPDLIHVRPRPVEGRVALVLAVAAPVEKSGARVEGDVVIDEGVAIHPEADVERLAGELPLRPRRGLELLAPGAEAAGQDPRPG